MNTARTQAQGDTTAGAVESGTAARGPAVEKGQVLLLREDAVNTLPVRYRLWTVASVRLSGTGRAAVRLIGWSPGCMMEATATFPEGLIADPWQLFGLSQRDLAFVWGANCGTTDALGASPKVSVSPGVAAEGETR